MSGLLYVSKASPRQFSLKHGGKWEVRLLSENEEQRLKELNETEEEYSDLWKVFFENIAVKERENKKLQTGNLPLRFREHMTEFEK